MSSHDRLRSYFLSFGWILLECELQAANETELLAFYILYLPKSSSPNPSNHFFSSSFDVLSAIALNIFEFLITSSSTNIGQSRRNASASASLDSVCPARSIHINA